MDGSNNNIYRPTGNLFDVVYPVNVAPQAIAPAGNPPLEGAFPPVLAAAPAGNVPVAGAVPPRMAAAPAGTVPVVGAVPLSPAMAAAPAGNVPVAGAVPPRMASAPAGTVPVVGAVPLPPAMAAAPAGNVPVAGAVPPRMASAPAAGTVPVVGAVPLPPAMAAAPAGNVHVAGAVPPRMASAPAAGTVPVVGAVPLPPAMAAAPAGNVHVAGAVPLPPAMVAAPAGNVPVAGAVPPRMASAPAAWTVPVVGAVPLPPAMAAAPAGNVPLAGAFPPGMASAPTRNVPVVGPVRPAMAAGSAGNVPVEGAAPLGMAPAGDVPVIAAVPVRVVPPAVISGTGGGESGEGTGGVGGADTSGRKKRGRPRKYDDQGNLIAPTGTAAEGPSRSGQKGRARAVGSGNLQPPTHSQSGEAGNNLPLSMVGWGFTTHLITVDIGEDVAVKIATLAVHSGPKGLCVLSASGAVSKVSIRQLGVSGGVESFEGLFQLMALSGSFSAADESIRRGRAGGLSVALSGADGRIIGGTIAGTLVAASPIKVIVGTFLTSDYWQQDIKGKGRLQEPASATPRAPILSRPGAAPVPLVNPGVSIFASPMQAGHVMNPRANPYPSVPMQPDHLGSHNEPVARNRSVDGAGSSNPGHATVQRTPLADMNPQFSFRRG